jgi:hypothetical protein
MYEKNNQFLLQKVFFTLFGSNSLPRGIVIIVPIEKIFKKIKDSFPLEEATKGWWKRAVVKINSSLVTVLKIPSGSNYIRDCLSILDNPEVKGIIFLGYCASFSKKIKIGQIVIPTQALFRKRRISLFKQKFLGLPKNKRYKIALLQQLLLPRKKIKKIKAQLGDMETYFLYKFSKIKKIPALPLLIVTDNPLFYPFYCVSKVDKIKIKSSLKKLMILLKQYIHTFQKIK